MSKNVQEYEKNGRFLSKKVAFCSENFPQITGLSPIRDPLGIIIRNMTHLAVQQENLLVPIRRLPGCQDIPLPAYHSQHAAGMDVHAAVPADQPVVIEPNTQALIPCGISLAVPQGYEAQIRPRSGLAAKHGITMPNTPGTIDADYRGELKIPLMNLGHEAFVVTRGMRIAQMLIKPVPRTQWVEVSELPHTQRGDGGFGHTGH